MKFDNLPNETREKLESSFTPELLEKLKACGTVDEVMKLMSENDLQPLDDDMLELIAGGGCISPGPCAV
ncbi:MAG: hypothetical protein IJQ88_03495 [Clostridia bacterium]|nr:hypothetical protein [Clostridia bacterium]